MEKKKQDNYNIQNLTVNKVPITTNTPQEYKPKITPLTLNLKQNENIHMQDAQDHANTNANAYLGAQTLNLDSKVQNFVQNCVETEMFKLRGFIHEEINSLHVDLIRQFEIQHVSLIYF